MADDQAPQPLLQPVGHHQEGQPDEGQQYQQGIPGERPLRPQLVEELGQQSDQDQVGAGQQYGNGILYRGSGKVDLHMEVLGAVDTPEKENVGDQQGDGVDDAEIGIHGVVEQRLAAAVNPGAGDGSDTQDEELDLPAYMAAGGAQRAFEIIEYQDGGEQKPEMVDLSRRAQGERSGDLRNQAGDDQEKGVPFPPDGQEGNHKYGGHRPLPALELPAPVAASEAQAEHQPYPRQQGGYRNPGLLPEEEGLRRCLEPHAAEDLLQRQQSHGQGE